MKNTQLKSIVYVSDSEALNREIVQANQLTAEQTLIISIQRGFTLTADITPINTNPNVQVIIQSDSGYTINIDGGGKYRGFVILNGEVTLKNLNLQNMVSDGLAPDCMGAGAGLSVVSPSLSPASNKLTPTVTLTNTNFTGCTSQYSSVKTLTFGGGGGSRAAVPDTGGQKVQIYGGDVVDRICINDIPYGGSGGGLKADFVLPTTGLFTLLEVGMWGHVIGYIKLSCQGTIYQAGSNSGDGLLVFDPGLIVTFAGIQSGDKVDAISFNIIKTLPLV